MFTRYYPYVILLFIQNSLYINYFLIFLYHDQQRVIVFFSY